LLVVPTYETGCVEVAELGRGTTSCPGGVSHTTLLEENGTHVLWLLAAPVVLTAIGALLPGRGPRIAVATALAGFALLTGFSIGAGYLPAVAAMAIAASRAPRQPLVGRREPTAGAR
jgi:hypothetical protein